MHTSIKLNTPCELINLQPINPLISKCQIKVCYVGEEPNRNGSIITKEVAKDMANSLPGSPIVGFFNKDTGDFEEHNRITDISNGRFDVIDTTKPYGFVDLSAKAWFQKFLDDGVEHEYLMTEGYLWTGQYPEAQRILERGNNQSMELDANSLSGTWTEDDNNFYEFFIINEAIISKLCILGEDVEPCFEGAQITNVQFSFDEDFKNKLFALIEQVNRINNEGGKSVEENKDLEVTSVEEELEPTDEPQEDLIEEEKEEEEILEDEPVEEEPEEEEEKEEESEEEPAEEDAPEEDKPVEYNLDEIQEYIELTEKYSALEADYNALQEQYSSLQTSFDALVEFKNAVELKEKQAMIDKFYMLSDEDKKDVIDNIETYSLDDIEAKLSIICVRNKISFDLDKDENADADPIMYNLGGEDISSNALVPDWVKAVDAVAKSKKN
jgi:hypothetical protein